MIEPLLPTAAIRKWRWATVATTSVSAIITIVYVTILVDAGSGSMGWLLPRLMQLGVYLSAIAAASCAGRLNVEGTRHLINRRVVEAASRMDRRLDVIAVGMIEHGIKLDDITEEIPRIREGVRVVRQRSHVHAPTVYVAAPDKMTAIGTASVEEPEPEAPGDYDKGWADGAAGRPLKPSGNVKRIHPHQN